MSRFHHAFAFTGGSDSEFFRRCRRDGRSFAWADDAQVFETMPRSRTTVGYLLRRKFRTGTDATRIERKFAANYRRRRCVHWCKGLGLLGFGILSLPIAALWRPPADHEQPDPGGPRSRLHRRGVRHLLRGIPIAPMFVQAPARTSNGGSLPAKVAGMASRLHRAPNPQQDAAACATLPPIVTFTFDDVPASACEIGAQHPRAIRRTRNFLYRRSQLRYSQPGGPPLRVDRPAPDDLGERARDRMPHLLPSCVRASASPSSAWSSSAINLSLRTSTATSRCEISPTLTATSQSRTKRYLEARFDSCRSGPSPASIAASPISARSKPGRWKTHRYRSRQDRRTDRRDRTHQWMADLLQPRCRGTAERYTAFLPICSNGPSARQSDAGCVLDDRCRRS